MSLEKKTVKSREKDIKGDKETKETKISKGKLANEEFWGEVPEITSNICGLIENDYVIVSQIDDTIERDYAYYHLYSFAKPEEVTNKIINFFTIDI